MSFNRRDIFFYKTTVIFKKSVSLQLIIQIQPTMRKLLKPCMPILWLNTFCIMAFTSCAQKEQAPKDTIVNVKTMKVASSSHVIGKSYMGTIEEEDGANVSFGVVGTVVKVMVDEGQFVRKGQAMAEVDWQNVRNAHEYVLERTS